MPWLICYQASVNNSPAFARTNKEPVHGWPNALRETEPTQQYSTKEGLFSEHKLPSPFPRKCGRRAKQLPGSTRALCQALCCNSMPKCATFHWISSPHTTMLDTGYNIKPIRTCKVKKNGSLALRCMVIMVQCGTHSFPGAGRCD